MNNYEPTALPEKEVDIGKHDIANLDEFDYITLLMESRIIQAS